jgi:hypothetical protein
MTMRGDDDDAGAMTTRGGMTTYEEINGP